MKTKVYVVEDMAISRIALIENLTASNFEVLGSAATAETAWLEIEKSKADLVILDINLAGKNDGIWIAEKIREHLNIAIIFLTAYSDDITLERVKNVNPNGFLMKPYNKAVLVTTIDIALKAFQKEVLLKQSTDLYVIVDEKSKKMKIALCEILYIQSKANYIIIKTINEILVTRIKLKAFLESLPENNFIVQVHLRFVVNKNRISDIYSNNIFIESTEIPVSKTYKNNLF